MEIMVSMSGNPEDRSCLEEIMSLTAGVELSSYGLVGIQSENAWGDRFENHQKMVAQFHGKVAMHGPFLGIEYNHSDHLIKDAIQKRMDLTFETAKSLGVFRVVLHSGFKLEYEQFQLEDEWLTTACDYWRQEIRRWEKANIQVVIENIVDRSCYLLNRFIDEVESPFLRLCLDIGHVNVFSPIPPEKWVKSMGERLYHVHLHDNDSITDRHWPMGKGNIDFEPFYEALETHAPHATLSLEQSSSILDRMGALRKLKRRFL